MEREKQMKKPNIIIIITDQQASWTISTYGKQSFLQTQHLDSIANNGIAFENYFVNTNPCTPSRGTFLTGLYPHSHGAFANNIPIDQSKQTFAHLLLNADYDTCYIGKYHLDGDRRPGWVHESRGMGFKNNLLMFNRGHFKSIKNIIPKQNPQTANDQPLMTPEIGNEKSYATDWLTNKAINYINEQGYKPFCLMISYPDPHPPYKTRQPYQGLYDENLMPIPENFNDSFRKGFFCAKQQHKQPDNLKKIMSQYCGMVKLIDDNVGKILSELKKLQIYEDTLIVFTSDHGDYMGTHGLLGKGGMHEPAYKVPMIMKPAKNIKIKSGKDLLWSSVDFAPTLLGLLDITVNQKFEGTNHANILKLENNCKNISNTHALMVEKSVTHEEMVERVGIITSGFWYAINNYGTDILYHRSKDQLQAKDLSTISGYEHIRRKLFKTLIKEHMQINSPQYVWLKSLQKEKDP